MSGKGVTVVCTACGRPDLLRRTLSSFFQYNTYPIEKFIVIEDSGIKGVNDLLKKDYPLITWMHNAKRLGQVKSIDRAYTQVNSEYIFHMEDDWSFYRSGFIEKSLPILESDPKILQVWIRHLSDLNGHGTIGTPNSYRIVKSNHRGLFHGFSWNPGLRRLSDWEKIGPFSRHTTFNPAKAGQSEIDIGKLYHELGYYAVVLKEGYVRHIGQNRHVN